MLTLLREYLVNLLSDIYCTTETFPIVLIYYNEMCFGLFQSVISNYVYVLLIVRLRHTINTMVRLKQIQYAIHTHSN